MNVIAFLALLFGAFLTDTVEEGIAVAIFAIGFGLIPFIFVFVVRELNER